MRIGCSKLNADLCNNLHVINDTRCSCGHPNENPYHFFFQCPLFDQDRDILMRDIQGITDMTVQNLLFGNADLTLEENKRVFDGVHKFIVNTRRFH